MEKWYIEIIYPNGSKYSKGPYYDEEEAENILYLLSEEDKRGIYKLLKK